MTILLLSVRFVSLTFVLGVCVPPRKNKEKSVASHQLVNSNTDRMAITATAPANKIANKTKYIRHTSAY